MRLLVHGFSRINLNRVPSCLHALHVAPDGRLSAVGAHGAIFQSRDGGRTWQKRSSGTPATLYAITPGSREKLGILTGKMEAIYTLPWKFSTELRIEIDLLAGKRCTTRAMPVDPGDDIELIIDVDMNGSPLCGGG